MYKRVSRRYYARGSTGGSSANLTKGYVRLGFNYTVLSGLSGSKLLLWNGAREGRYRMESVTISQIINNDSDLQALASRFRQMRVRKLTLTLEFQGTSSTEYMQNRVVGEVPWTGARRTNRNDPANYNPQTGDYTDFNVFNPPYDTNDQMRNTFVYTINDSKLLRLHRKGFGSDGYPEIMLSQRHEDIVQEGSKAIRMKRLLGTRAISRDLAFYEYNIDSQSLGSGSTIRYSSRPARRITWINLRDDLTNQAQPLYGVHWGYCVRDGVVMPSQLGSALVVPMRVLLTGVVEFRRWDTNAS